ncbi:MAG: energy-coupling factor transporter transmembrane protein EcfT [Thermoflexales bacterium]|nr:energy-coupling factor transporter transmembrane protein EcfT [Thermoflexales bacterium]
MKRQAASGQVWSQSLVASSPLRQADPRTKLALSLGVSMAAMLPLERLLAVMGIYLLLLGWARLWPPAARQVWRLKWILSLLFLLDWLLISLDLAVIVTMRLILLAGAFTLFFATTTPGELRLALEWIGVPYRYAFSLSLAFQSINVLDEEWRAIREAQRSRGAWAPLSDWKKLPGYVRELVALAVPAIVMTAKRAWAMTEAAYARGFDSPHRRPYRRLAMGRLDWLLLSLALTANAAVMLWRF